MVRQVVFAPEAIDQLIAIYRYIAERATPATAHSFTGRIVDYCDSFTAFPERGARRDDIRPGLRLVGFRRRVTVAFTVENATIIILGIFYGGQDYESALRQSEKSDLE